jgi:hypothetical protein
VIAAIDAAHSEKVPAIGKRDTVAKRDRALDQLNAKAEELRNMHPELSPEQAFSRVYKMNPELAKAERSAARAAIGA